MTLSLSQQHPAAQQGLSTFLVPSPLTDSGLLTGKASFKSVFYYHFSIRLSIHKCDERRKFSVKFRISNSGELQPDIIIIASSLLSGVVHLSPSRPLRWTSGENVNQHLWPETILISYLYQHIPSRRGNLPPAANGVAHGAPQRTDSCHDKAKRVAQELQWEEKVPWRT